MCPSPLKPLNQAVWLGSLQANNLQPLLSCLACFLAPCPHNNPRSSVTPWVCLSYSSLLQISCGYIVFCPTTPLAPLPLSLLSLFSRALGLLCVLPLPPVPETLPLLCPLSSCSCSGTLTLILTTPSVNAQPSAHSYTQGYPGS